MEGIMNGSEGEKSVGAGEVPERERLMIEVFDFDLSLQQILGAAALLLLLLAPVVGGGYTYILINQAMLLAIFAIGVDLIWGVTGIMTFGHAAFFGLGAYLMTGVLKTSQIGDPASYIGLVVAVVVPAVVGLIIAGPLFYQDIGAFRFTIITLAVAIIAEQVAISWRSVTGGFEGIMGIPRLEVGIPYVQMVPVDGVAFYYLSIGVLLAVYWFTVRTVNSPFGSVLKAISENEQKARALGYNTPKYKTIMFAMGSGMAGLGGALYAPYNGFVSPNQLGFVLSTSVLLWVLVGGRGTVVGAILGTILLTVFENVISGVFAYTWTLLMGLTLVAIVLVYPGGIMGLVDLAEQRIQDMRTGS